VGHIILYDLNNWDEVKTLAFSQSIELMLKETRQYFLDNRAYHLMSIKSVVKATAIFGLWQCTFRSRLIPRAPGERD
jgi:hypothetical protein